MHPSNLERICLRCGVRYEGTDKCPVCQSKSWEFYNYRVRKTPESQEPLKTPLPGSTDDYTTEKTNG